MFMFSWSDDSSGDEREEVGPTVVPLKTTAILQGLDSIHFRIFTKKSS